MAVDDGQQGDVGRQQAGIQVGEAGEFDGIGDCDDELLAHLDPQHHLLLHTVNLVDNTPEHSIAHCTIPSNTIIVDTCVTAGIIVDIIVGCVVTCVITCVGCVGIVVFCGVMSMITI